MVALFGYREIIHKCSSKAFIQNSQTSVVAQPDGHPTSDQGAPGLIPVESGNIISCRLIMKYFLQSFSLLLIEEGQLSVSGERMCTSAGELLRGLSLPRKNLVR